MNQFRFSVSLRVFSKAVDPTEICERLGLEPKVKQRMGDPRKTTNGDLLKGNYDQTACVFSLTQQNDEKLHEMLDRVCDSLKPHQDLFQQIRDCGGRAEFFIGWFLTSRSAGESLESSLLSKLGTLGINLAAKCNEVPCADACMNLLNAGRLFGPGGQPLQYK